MILVKAHAYGNDFLLHEADEPNGRRDWAAEARRLCDRHHGIGGDGLIVFRRQGDGAIMRLLNADGSPSEVSGNGVRCLAAWLASRQSARIVDITTDAGVKRLELLDGDGRQFLFRAAMGPPERIERRTLEVAGERVDAITLRVGNPQCVVLGDVTHARLHSLAAGLSTHSAFPEGTNVELATLEAPDRVRILIWERGVGPTQASGTGACAAAVAAMQFADAARELDVIAPGGTQRVEWRADGLYLTGTACLVGEIRTLEGGDG